ncbi:nephrin isoform X1 [Ctenopharyngodon idella]|uniref:nephrin isoform X1 n=1 Tax=Ctenopharyngodon idella TaxID=7959 RepID=UPI0022304ACD|nr:nephrin isoform X1 [Ctenopharyngodon idella]XP_051718569.1 nephrin isoform X1 [Ctenopharyngodon idella]
MDFLFSLVLSSAWVFLLVDFKGVCGQQAFKTEPRNVTVKAGATTLLKCEVLRASGAVQWVKDGLLLGPQRSLPGYPRYSMTGDQQKGQYHLQILNVSLEDDGPYECQVGQSVSSRAIVSRTAWLNVQIPPSQPYIQLESDEPWVEGDKYTVTCIAPDAKPPAEITMFRDGEELTETDSFTMSGSQDKLLNTHAEVLIRARSSDDTRRLTCRAKNPASPRALETGMTMRVYFPPQAPVIIGLENEEVRAGSLLRVVCMSYGGNPLATLHWIKNGKVLSTSWEVDIVSRRSSSVLKMEVKPEDNHAVLQCESVNQVSRSPMSLTRTLTVMFEPAEVTLLGSFEAIEGQEINLSCYTSSSNPPVHIRWWLGFKELNRTNVTISEGDNGGMMTLSNLTHKVSREDNGLPLTCEAFNKGTRFSSVRSEELIVYYPPQKVWLDAPPPNVFLHAGSTLRLVCFSSGGNPTGQLVWFKNNKVVPTASKLVSSERGVSRDLLLTLQPSDNLATYRCDSSNKAKKVISAQTKLRVLFPAVSVKIVAKQKELRKGQTLDLDCLAGSSNPTANISWSLGPMMLKGVDQAPKKAEFGGMSRTSKLSLTLDSHHWKKRITCQAFSNVLSEGVNNFYSLNVLFPPEFTDDQPDEVQVIEDETATLPVKVLANPDEITCEWIFQGEKLVKERDPRYHFDDWTLEIVNVSRRDGGDYIIECSNAEGKNRTKLKLDVQYSPTVLMKSDPVSVNLGDTADLLCVADANPITSSMFSWKWMGEEEVDDLGEQSEDEGTGLLTIYEVTRDRAGFYQCTADNGIAPPGSVEGQLIVRFTPELQKGPQWKKVASRGDGSNDANVVCQAQGVPRVHFTWAKNGFPLDLGNPRYEEKTVVTGTVHTSVLTVINVSAALDYAIFTCTAHNSMGEDSLDIQLLSTNHPDPPSDLKLLRVNHNSVTLEWMPGFDGGLTQNFRVRYQWAGSVSFMYVDVFPPTATVYTVTGLNPSTAYNFSVNALNTMGESSYADNNKILTVTTADAEEADDGVSPADKDPALAGRGLPVYAVVILVVGGLLLFLNPLSCFLLARWKKRGWSLKEDTRSISQETKSEEQRSTSSSSTRYASRELINASAQRTLLIDSSSEPDSSVYESYGRQENSHYYYSPALYTHFEGPEDLDGRHGTSPLAHDYEEVTGWGTYQDLQGYSLLPPAAHSDPRALSTYHEGRVYGKADVDVAAGVYDSMVYRRRRDTDLPFELRGELV